MQKTITVNGVIVKKYQSPIVSGILCVIDENNTLTVMCHEGTSDEECIKYVYQNYKELLLNTNTTTQKNTKPNQKPQSQIRKNTLPKVVRTESISYNPMNDPRNPFSPVVPKGEDKPIGQTGDFILSRLVKNSPGHHIRYNFTCCCCGNAFVTGCEYTDGRGRKYVVCNYCRGEILKFKGWIHEISANIGGKK